jgi:hypothetical protein
MVVGPDHPWAPAEENGVRGGRRRLRPGARPSGALDGRLLRREIDIGRRVRESGSDRLLPVIDAADTNDALLLVMARAGEPLSAAGEVRGLDAREAHAAAKREAARVWADHDAYTEAKSDVILGILDRAEAWADATGWRIGG